MQRRKHFSCLTLHPDAIKYRCRSSSLRVYECFRDAAKFSLPVPCSLAMHRDTRASYAYKLDPASESTTTPVAAVLRPSLPGQPSEADLGEERSQLCQQQQQAARVLMQVEMISCGASVAPLRPRPLVRTRLPSSSGRAPPAASFSTTVGDARLVVLPYDAPNATVHYSMSSPVLPLVTSGEAARQVASYRPTAASDPAIQNFGFEQKLLEDRKVEKLRSLKDSKRRRHELSLPPHRLGTLKIGSGSGERRKSRRSMSFAGKSHAESQWVIASRGPSKPSSCGAEGPSERGMTKQLGRARYVKAPRRRKIVGLHGNQAAFSEGDVAKDGAEDEDSSSTGELYTNERDLHHRMESPITAFQSTHEALAIGGKTQQGEEELFADHNDSLKSQAKALEGDE